MLALILAQDSTQKVNPAASLVPLIALVAIFYFLMIRPQRRRMQQHQALLRQIELGDEVETIGGVFGTVRRLDEDLAWIEISPGTTIKVSRSAIRRKIIEIQEEEEAGDGEKPSE